MNHLEDEKSYQQFYNNVGSFNLTLKYLIDVTND